MDKDEMMKDFLTELALFYAESCDAHEYFEKLESFEASCKDAGINEQFQEFLQASEQATIDKLISVYKNGVKDGLKLATI